ncbi:MAG: TlpA family protein disulfide reductase [Sulfurovaceae bacterium]|nr:TlpA family protein disulfide reductase [Sulfurovaceae bacterium]
MKSIKFIILSIFLLSTLLLSSENNNTNPIEEKEQKFKLTTLEGKTLNITTKKNGLNIEGLKGKVVFLSFFGYNCPPCKREIPEFIKMRNKYSKDLEIIAIEIRGLKKNQLNNFINRKNINYPIIPFNKEAKKFAYHTAKKADWKGAIPFILVLDREGEVKFLQTGFIPYSALESAFQASK